MLDELLQPRSVAVVLGTRPEIIKLAPLITVLGRAVRLIHTGQHYDATLSDAFLAAFDLERPLVHMNIGGVSRGQQIGTATAALDAELEGDPPRVLVVQGDTNSTLAAALAANARGLPLVHVEAGLRSYDRAMPEEHNRVLTDHLSDLCLCPTDVAAGNLRREGIADHRIVVTGNTVVDALELLLPSHQRREAVLRRLGLEKQGFVLSTFHRPENVDDPSRLGLILEQLAEVPLPVVLPLHPRSVERARRYGLSDRLGGLIVTEPLGYPKFLGLMAEAAIVVSDSGGIQEEVSVLKRPVVVVRRSTERPEVLGTFARLVPPGPDIASTVSEWLRELEKNPDQLKSIPTPYGDGTAAKRSLEAIVELLAGG